MLILILKVGWMIEFSVPDLVDKGENLNIFFSHEFLPAAHIKSSLGGTNRNNSPSTLLLHNQCWRSTNDSDNPPEACHKSTGHCLTTQGSRRRPIHCVVITEKDIRGVALTHSSEEPFALSCIVPGDWQRLQRRSFSKPLAQKHTAGPALAWCRPWTVAPGLPGPC